MEGGQRRRPSGAAVRSASVHWREIDVSCVDAVEHVGENAGRDGKADVGQLLVGIAGRLDRCELLVADVAAGRRQVPDKGCQGVAFRVTGRLALPELADCVCRQAGQLADQAVRGDAIVAAGGDADDKLDGFNIVLADRSRCAIASFDLRIAMPNAFAAIGALNPAALNALIDLDGSQCS